jgi:hypothetical protein
LLFDPIDLLLFLFDLVEDLFVFGSEHGDHFPVLISLFLRLSLGPPTLIFQVRRLILSFSQFSGAFLQTALRLLHKAAVLFFFEVNSSNIILNLASELQVFLPKADQFDEAPQGLLVVGSIRQLPEWETPAGQH